MPIIRAPGAKAYVALLHQRVPEKKAQHAIFVAEFVSSFAERVGVDHDLAVTAGLLHDLCRTLENEEMLRRARAYGIVVQPWHEAKPNLLHGPVAAEEIRRELAVDDPDVYDAVYWHTTGRPRFCRLGQALYVADFAEPTRDYAEAARTRELLRREGFEAALRYAAEARLRFHRDTAVLDPTSAAFHAWVEEEFGA
ncbi:MAG TPA: bis(5'-nucleosyl)-tetraphosphatase (symmetrical) YqeK [Candidatus Hydrogenedentes bacterium]|nr:bis(5'-nucleosyl)-tetraphosphatase (symmetrical) YqeK [Candidatus Hydrogenedentota bacterium]